MFRIQILILEWDSKLAGEALHRIIGVIIYIVVQGQRGDNDFSNRMTLVGTAVKLILNLLLRIASGIELTASSHR